MEMAMEVVATIVAGNGTVAVAVAVIGILMEISVVTTVTTMAAVVVVVATATTETPSILRPVSKRLKKCVIPWNVTNGVAIMAIIITTMRIVVKLVAMAAAEVLPELEHFLVRLKENSTHTMEAAAAVVVAIAVKVQTTIAKIIGHRIRAITVVAIVIAVKVVWQVRHRVLGTEDIIVVISRTGSLHTSIATTIGRTHTVYTDSQRRIIGTKRITIVSCHKKLIHK